MSGEHTLTFSDATFNDEVLASKLPVLVNLWADGCGGCRQIAPLIDLMATEYVSKAKVGKLNAMSNAAIAMKYNIRSVPTVLVFKDGKVVEQRVGVSQEADLRRMLDRHVRTDLTARS